VGDYLKAGAFAVGAGSDLADCKAIAESRSQDISATARAYMQAVEAYRREQVLLRQEEPQAGE
jgi:2-keto-3-deoxy-6-phosphogluconate aldolase